MTSTTNSTTKPKARTRRTKTTTNPALSIVPTTEAVVGTAPAVDPTPAVPITSSTTLPARLALSDLHPNLRNVRRQVTDLDELIDSIRSFGVLQPLTVAPHPDLPGQWVIIAGHRRHAAAVQAEVVDVPVVARADLVEPVDVIAAMLAENLHRADLTPIEEASGYQQLIDLGLTEAAVAKRTGRSKTTITRRLSLLALPEETRDKVHAHQVTLEQALVLAEFADDPAALRRLEQALDDYGDLRHAAERERETREVAARHAALRAALTGEGWAIATWPHDVNAPETIARLSKPLAFHEISTLPGYRHLDADGRSKAHAGCPHRAAYIFPTGDDWLEVCLQPATHKPDPTPGSPDVAERAGFKEGPDYQDDAADLDDSGLQSLSAEDAADLARADEQARQAETDLADCRAAARVRRDYLRDLTTGRVRLTDDMRDAITRHIALLAVATDVPFGYPEPTALADLIGIDVDAIAENGGDEFTVDDQLRKTIWTLPDPHRALLAALTLGSEDLLDRPERWTPAKLRKPDPDAVPSDDPLSHRAWLDLVGGPLGYEFTPWEVDHLDAADPTTGK